MMEAKASNSRRIKLQPQLPSNLGDWRVISVCVTLISFLRRSGNGVAHCLASKGYRGLGVSTWEAYPLIWLSTPLTKN